MDLVRQMLLRHLYAIDQNYLRLFEYGLTSGSSRIVAAEPQTVCFELN